jgi:hypothetical protein
MIGILLFYWWMSPSDNSSLELKTLWFIEGVPLWVKRLALAGIIVLGLTLLIKLINTRSEPGTLTVTDQKLEICTSKKLIQLPYDEIKEIAFVAAPLSGDEFRVFFKTKLDKIIRIKLAHYLLADELTDSLSGLATKNVKILSGMADPYEWEG